MRSPSLKDRDVLEWPFDIDEAPIGMAIDGGSSEFEIRSVIGAKVEPRSCQRLGAEEI